MLRPSKILEAPSDEFKQILEFLQKRNDYIVWAGFAVYAYFGERHSLDIDIYTKSETVKKEISKEFQKKDWKVNHYKKDNFEWDQLIKGKTSFDVVYSKTASKYLFKQDVSVIKVYGYKLRFLSKEWLFLTKLGQLTYKKRSEEKRKRDIKVIQKLRSLIDINKVRKYSPILPASFWKSGDI